MSSWLLPALLAVICFGLWGLFAKLAALHIDARSALFFQAVGYFVIGLLTLNLLKYKPEANVKGLSFAILSGVASAVGCLFYFYAADKGRTSTVVTMTALYPVVTILLAFMMMRESIDLRQSFGIFLGLVAIYFLS